MVWTPEANERRKTSYENMEGPGNRKEERRETQDNVGYKHRIFSGTSFDSGIRQEQLERISLEEVGEMISFVGRLLSEMTINCSYRVCVLCKIIILVVIDYCNFAYNVHL